MCNISRYELFFFVKLLVKKMNPSVLCKDILIFSSHTLYTANFLQKSSDWTIACYRRFFTSLTDRAGHWVCPVSTIPLHTALGDDTNSNLLISSVFRQWRYFRRRLCVGKMPFFYFLDWCLLSAVFNILSFGWKIELYKTGRLEKYFTTLSTYSKIFENFWVNVTWPPKSAQCAMSGYLSVLILLHQCDL